MTAPAMSLEEIVLGTACEQRDDLTRTAIRPVHCDPQEVLGDVLLGLLQRGRVAVAFSGGVDSSGLLCLATQVARAHGLDEPIAVTARFPDAPSSDESSWQELVIGHLGLADWVKVECRDDCDVIGVEAQVGLRRHGVRWPPLVHAEQPLMRACRGSIYVMGNGGDEITFPTRAGVAQLLAHGTVRRDRAALRALVADLRPDLGWIHRGPWSTVPPWVRPQARPHLAAIARADHRQRRFRWARTLEDRTTAAWARRGHATMVASGADAGVELVQPFTDPAVVGAMAVAGARWGFPDRAAAAAVLFGDALPVEVRRRRDKVDFTDAYIARPSREFIAAWDGTGVPTDLVDVDALAREWRSPRPRYTSLPLLQHAWLTQHADT